MNNIEELQQISVNPFIRVSIGVDVSHPDAECAAVSPVLDREPMALEDFKVWWSQRMVHINITSDSFSP